MRKTIMALVILLLPLAALARLGEIRLNARTHTFANGLQLVVVERHWSPTVSFVVRFKVGSVDEHPGITGSAHLLEHMLFKGTRDLGTTDYDAEVPLMTKIDTLAHDLTAAIEKERFPLYRGGTGESDSLKARIARIQGQEKKYIVKDEIWETYLRNGGSGLNASTGNDGTQYYVSLPKNRLELWAFIESDRLRGPIFREFYSERDVVHEERRLSIDNEPGGKLEEQLYAAAFTAHPYEWPVVGWASDLETVLREQVAAFFHQYYSPNNIVISVVGDVDFNDVVRTVGKYFDNIPASEIPPPPVTTVEPEQTGERRVSVEFDAQPQLVIGWHEPAGGSEGKEAFDIIANLLSRGRTSRLYKALVVDKQLVASINASSDFTRYPDLFSIWATPKAPHTVNEVEQGIYEEIAKLQKDGPTQWELQRTRNQLDADYVRSLQSNRGLAFRLADMQALTGDWSYITKLKEARLKVTSDDVKKALAKYFTQDNRTVAYIIHTPGNQTATKTTAHPQGVQQ